MGCYGSLPAPLFLRSYCVLLNQVLLFFLLIILLLLLLRLPCVRVYVMRESATVCLWRSEDGSRKSVFPSWVPGMAQRPPAQLAQQTLLATVSTTLWFSSFLASVFCFVLLEIKHHCIIRTSNLLFRPPASQPQVTGARQRLGSRASELTPQSSAPCLPRT